MDYIIAHQDKETGWLGPGVGVEEEAQHHPIPDYKHDEDVHDLFDNDHSHSHSHSHSHVDDGEGGVGRGSGGSDTYWARYYLLMTFAIEAEATTNVTERSQLINVMLKHVHAAADKMKAESWLVAFLYSNMIERVNSLPRLSDQHTRSICVC